MRTIFRDELLAPYNGNAAPQYRIQTGGDASTLTLLNAVTQPGTPLSAGNLNNLFDFDNTAGQAGYSKTTVFTTTAVTETIKNTATQAVAATRETTFPANAIQVIETVFDDDGVTVLRQTKQTTTFPSTTTIAEEVMDV